MSQPVTVSEEYLTQLCTAVAEKAAKAAAEAATATAYSQGFQAGQSSAPAEPSSPSPTSGKGHGKGKSTKGKKEKVTDSFELDTARTITMHLRDPRALGEGPCRLTHTPKEKGNQWARWTECKVCGLRMTYMPYSHAPAGSTRMENPGDVRAALRELWEMEVWNQMTARVMQNKIKEIAVRKATIASPAYQRSKAKAKARAEPVEYHMHSDEENNPTANQEAWEQAEEEWNNVNPTNPARPAEGDHA